jgi:uncharacterized protein
VLDDAKGHVREPRAYSRRAAAGQTTTLLYFAGMRLTENEIQFISRKIVKTLVAFEKLEVDDEHRVVDNIAKVITDELQVEDRLNEEVREVLIQHASEMERSNVTYTEMFKMLKKKMAREKGIVL